MLDVIGAGFGRTGTLSLKLALEELGFSKCYHMSEVVANPPHVDLWRAAWRGDDLWDDIFAGYRAAVDWPAVAFWTRLLRYYPSAKVVLTVRDADTWYRSARGTIFRSMTEGLSTKDPVRYDRMRLLKEIIIDGTFNGSLDDERNVVAVYSRHVERVIAEVPSDRLVLFDPREGWPPLCAAFDLAVPRVPFPRVNTFNKFVERWRGGDPNRSIAMTGTGGSADRDPGAPDGKASEA